MNEPHGGTLVDRWTTPPDPAAVETARKEGKSLNIDLRFVIDAVSIADGIFSPLTGFMTADQVRRTAEDLMLEDGTVWAIPVVLPIFAEAASRLSVGDKALMEWEGTPFGWVTVEEIYDLDVDKFVADVFQTTDTSHPGVALWKGMADRKMVAGPVDIFANPLPAPVADHYMAPPKKVREWIQQRGWKRIVAFQTRNPIHRAHEYLIKCALENADGVLIHPLVGSTKSDDIPADVRMQCYEALIDNYFNGDYTLLSALYANMHYAGPREALHHMIMRKNFGCTHMIIGRDHAGVGNFYGTYDAQEWALQWSERLGMEPLLFEHAFYCRKCEGMASGKTCPHPAEDRVHLSGTEVRRRLREGEPIPSTFSRPEVVKVLHEWVARS